MILITMNSKRLKLTVEGHAMPEENGGNDADTIGICNAVSALAQGLIYTISQYNNGEGTTKSIQYRNDPGDLMIKIFPEPWAEREIRHRFEIYADGLQLMAESHPQSVTFIRDGERIIAKEEQAHE